MRGLPELANDRPTVAASVELELVGVGVLENLPVSQPEHIGRFLVLGPGPFEGALHCDGFAQWWDDSSGTQLKLQIFKQERDKGSIFQSMLKGQTHKMLIW